MFWHQTSSIKFYRPKILSLKIQNLDITNSSLTEHRLFQRCKTKTSSYKKSINLDKGLRFGKTYRQWETLLKVAHKTTWKRPNNNELVKTDDSTTPPLKTTRCQEDNNHKVILSREILIWIQFSSRINNKWYRINILLFSINNKQDKVDQLWETNNTNNT